MSRQLDWQRRMMDEGRCRQCGKVSDAGDMCSLCRVKQRVSRRIKNNKPITGNEKGRKPTFALNEAQYLPQILKEIVS